MIAAILTLLVTLAFAAGPFLVPNFAGFSADLFPIPQIDPPVQPVGWAFAIWGPIYLWLLASAVFGLALRARDPDWTAVRPALIASLAIGAAWLPVAQQAPLIAALMIWAMLGTALAALARAPRADRLMCAWPIGLYAGWLSAAACVALGLNIAGYGWLPRVPAALAMIALATLLAAAVQISLGRVPSYGVAVVWALVGIYVANDGRHAEVAGLAMGAAIAMAALTLFAFLRELRRRAEF